MTIKVVNGITDEKFRELEKWWLEDQERQKQAAIEREIKRKEEERHKRRVQRIDRKRDKYIDAEYALDKAIFMLNKSHLKNPRRAWRRVREKVTDKILHDSFELFPVEV